MVIDPRKQHFTEGFPLATDTTLFPTARRNYHARSTREDYTITHVNIFRAVIKDIVAF